LPSDEQTKAFALQAERPFKIFDFFLSVIILLECVKVMV